MRMIGSHIKIEKPTIKSTSKEVVEEPIMKKKQFKKGAVLSSSNHLDWKKELDKL